MLLLAVLVLAGCSSGIAQETYDAAVAERDALAVQLQAAQSEATGLAGQLADEQTRTAGLEDTLSTAQTELESETGRADTAETSAEDYEGQLAVVTHALDSARTALEDLRIENADLLLAYDPQIQAAREEVTPLAFDLACTMGRANARANLAAPRASTVIDGLEPDYPGLDLTAILDADTITAEAERCHTDELAIMQVEALQELLTASRGDGFYTVGDEIAPGRWRSTGTGDECYWERLDSDQDILDNHFGIAGGTVTIRASDYEVRFDGCGIWEYLGP